MLIFGESDLEAPKAGTNASAEITNNNGMIFFMEGIIAQDGKSNIKYPTKLNHALSGSMVNYASQFLCWFLEHQLNLSCCGEFALWDVVVAELLAVNVELCKSAFLSVRVLNSNLEFFAAESLFD